MPPDKRRHQDWRSIIAAQQVEIVLRFPSKDAKNEFISGLLDDWGQELYTITPVEVGKDVFHATTFDIAALFDDEEDPDFDLYGMEKMKGDDGEL